MPLDPKDIERYTLEGLRDILPGVQMIEQSLDSDGLSQILGNGNYTLEAIYDFGKSNVDQKSGVDMLYRASNPGGEMLQEAVSIFTGYLEYDIKGAIQEFAKLDLPIIDYYFSDQEKAGDLGILEAVYYNPFVDPIITQGWKIIIGSQKVLIDDSPNYISSEQGKDLTEVLYQAFNNVLFQHPQTYFVKTWLTRVKNEGLWADCRVNLEDWEIGKQLLYQYADSWDMKAEKVSKKQSILLIPKEISELEQGDKILTDTQAFAAEQIRQREEAERAERKKKKKFWQFWK